MSTVQYIFFGIAVFIIGLSKGGLGGALPVALVLPMLSLVFDPKEAVPLMVPFLVIADWFALRIYWGKWDMHQVRLMLPAGVIGVIMGALLLSVISPTLLKIAIAVFTIIVIIYKLAADTLKSLTYTPRRWHGWLAGWASGFSSTLANTGGPPFTIYLLLQSLQPIAFIGTVTLFFAVVNFLKIPLFLQQGLLNVETVLQLAWAIPLLPFGVWLGRRSVDLFDQKLFERLLLVLLVGSVLLLLGTL